MPVVTLLLRNLLVLPSALVVCKVVGEAGTLWWACACIPCGCLSVAASSNTVTTLARQRQCPNEVRVTPDSARFDQPAVGAGGGVG